MHPLSITITLHDQPEAMDASMRLTQAFSAGDKAVRPRYLRTNSENRDVIVAFDHMLGNGSPALQRALAALESARLRAGVHAAERVTIELEPAAPDTHRYWDEEYDF